MALKLVLDTNIIISALKSQNGAANKLLSLIGTSYFTPYISVPLMFEYEDVIGRLFSHLSKEDVNHLLDYICKESIWCPIYYLWRPILDDYKDDMVLELSVAASVDYLVTYNVRDFSRADEFGIKLASPKDILSIIGEAK